MLEIACFSCLKSKKYISIKRINKIKKEFDLLSRNAGIIPAAYNSKIKFIDEIVSKSVKNVKKMFLNNVSFNI